MTENLYGQNKLKTENIITGEKDPLYFHTWCVRIINYQSIKWAVNDHEHGNRREKLSDNLSSTISRVFGLVKNERIIYEYLPWTWTTLI
jgi:hypothetical protein